MMPRKGYNWNPVSICGWPGFEISRGDIKIGVVPRVGGRIMSLCFRGEELLYAPHAGEVDVPGLGPVDDLAAFKRATGFRIFGGDKTWVGPEWSWLERCPPLDLDAGAYVYAEQDGSCVMTSPVCRETGLQVIRRVGFVPDVNSTEILLVETLINRADQPLERGVWNVTQITKPFQVQLPVVPGGLRSYHLEDKTLPDPLLALVEKNGWVMVPCEGDVCFKFGAVLREGHTAVWKETPQGRVIFARFFDIAPGAAYAHQSMAEVFNSSHYPYGEVEVHAPLSVIPPGGQVSLTQRWRIFEAGE
ncbi:MAG: hypothetical protein WCI27_04160 [Candidatus Omnitrophota bacterium]